MAAALPKVASYTKNLAKSVAFSAGEYMKHSSPNAAEFLENNEDFFKETFSAIKNYRETSKTVKKMARHSKIGEAFEEGKKALFEDLRTGKFYNQERIARFEVRAMGSDMSMDDWGDDWGDLDSNFGFDDNGDEEYSTARATIHSNRILSEKMGSAIDESIKANAEVTYKSAAHIGDSIQRSTSLIYAQNLKFHSMVNSGIAGIQSDLAKLSAVSAGLSTHMENARTYYEKSLAIFQENNAILKEMVEMQRNLYKREQESYSKSSGYQDVTSAGGTPDLKEYASKVLKNVKAQMPAEFSMLFGDDFGKDANMLLAFVGSPLKYLPDMLVRTLIPATLKKTAEVFDQTLGGIFPTLMAKAARAANDSDSELVQLIGKIFGLDIKTKTSVDTSKYNKGAVAFDGITRKSIIEVIPGYLARIEAALTGSGERIYDYDYGKWTDIRDIKRANDYRVRNAKVRTGYDTFGDLEKYLDDFTKANKEQGDALRKEVEEMFIKIYDDYGSFSLRDRDKEGFFDRDGTKAYEYYGFTDEEQFNRVVDLMKKNKGIYNLAGEMIDARERLARYYEDAENNMNSMVHLFNNSYNLANIDTKSPANKLTHGNFLTAAKDRFNKNIFDYLRGMYAELKAIRADGDIGGGNKKGRNRQSKSTSVRDPLEALERQLTEEIESANKTYDSTRTSDESETKSFEDFDQAFSIEESLRKADEDERNKKKKKDQRSLYERMSSTNSVLGKWRAIKDSLDTAISRPAVILAGLFDKADQRIFDVLFGNENTELLRDLEGRSIKSTMDYIVLRLQETFDNLNDWIHDHIFDPFMEWFKTTPAYEYMMKAKDKIKETVRPVGQALKDKMKFGGRVFTGAMRNTYGRAFNTASDYVAAARGTGPNSRTGVAQTVPVGYDPTNEEDYHEYMARGGDDIVESAYGRVVTKRGLTMISPGEIILPASIDKRFQNKQLREEIKMKNKLFPGLRTQFNAKGNVPPQGGNIPENDVDKIKKVTKKVIKEVSPNAPDIIADALIGGGVSLITGLIGGPLLGIAAGAGVGITRNSDFVQQKLFGDTVMVDKDGNTYREGGLIPPDIQKKFKKYFPDMRDFGIAGGVAALFTPMGLIPGLMLGSTVGFLKNNEQFQDFIFGEKNKDGERDGGLISKAFRDKVKKIAPRLAVGALGGVLFGPFGLLGNAVLGTALGFTTTTETFHNVIFGRKGDDGKRHGGLVGNIKDFIHSIIDFGKKNVLEPLKDFVTPFTQMVKNAVIGVAEGVKEHLNNMFEKTIGRPLSDFIEHKVIGGMTKWLKRLLFLPVTMAKGAVAAPFHMLGFIGNNIRNSQIRKGTARDMTAKQRLEWRDKHLTRGALDPRWDRFETLDKMLVEGFDETKEGTEKLQSFRDELSNYIEASHELGHDGAKIVKRVGDNISQFFNLESDVNNPGRSLYNTIGYKTIGKLHKLVKYGDIQGIDNWLQKRDEMTADQKVQLRRKIIEDVEQIAAIRDRQKKNKKLFRSGRAALSRETGGTLTSRKTLKRYLANVDKELEARKGNPDISKKTEEMMDPNARIINNTFANKSDAIIAELKDLNNKLRDIAKDTNKIDDNDVEKVFKDELSTSDAINRLYENATEEEKSKYRNKFGNLLTRLKNRKEKSSQAGNPDRDDDEVDVNGDVITGPKNKIIDRFKNAYHVMRDENGNLAIANALGQILPSKAKSAFLKKKNENEYERKKMSEIFSDMREGFFGKGGIRKAMKGAKNGLFGLISSVANSESIVSKILKGVLFGGTAIAAIGHGSEFLKKAMPSIKAFLSPVTDALKSIGKNITEALANAFPKIFGEDGVVPTALEKVKNFFTDLIQSPGRIFRGIFDWYKEGFTLFKANILTPLWATLKPELANLIGKAVLGGYSNFSEYLAAVESTTTSVNEYHATDRDGNKLYKDSAGNVTTSEYDEYGNKNEALTRSSVVTTTSYGDDGLPFSKARNALFAPNGRKTDYKQTATNEITGQDFELILSAKGQNAGECTIICKTTGDFIRFSGYNKSTGKYGKISLGYYCDKSGAAAMAGSVVGSLIVAGIAVAATVVSAGSLSAVTVPMALGAIVGTPTIAKVAGAAAGYHAGGLMYKFSDGGYATEYNLDPKSSDLPYIISFFGLQGIDSSDFDKWPAFTTSAEYENAYYHGTREQVSIAKQELSELDIESLKEKGKKENTENSITVPSNNTKIKYWGPYKNLSDGNKLYTFLEGTYMNPSISAMWPYLRSFYNNSGELVYYDTRSSYEALPIEIQNQYTKSSWIPNTDPTKTNSYATTEKAGDNDNIVVASTNSVPKTITSSSSSAITVRDNLTSNTAYKYTDTKADDFFAVINNAGKKALDTLLGKDSSGSSRSGESHIWQKQPGVGSTKFGNNTLGTDGCGPVTAANMINTLSGSGGLLDATTSIAKNYIDSTGGTTVDYFNDVFGRAGYSTRNSMNKSEIAQSIKAGNPAVLLGNSGTNTSSDPFGANDHYINVYGTDSRGNAIVEDPDLPQSRVKYPLNKVMRDTKYATMIGSSRYGKFISNIKRAAKSRMSGHGSYGTVTVYRAVGRAAAVTYAHESAGKFNAYLDNDNGYGVSFGLIGWNAAAGKAKEVLKTIVDINGGKNPGFTNAVYNAVIGSAPWGKKVFYGQDKQSIINVLDSEVGRMGQLKQICIDMNSAMEQVGKWGLSLTNNNEDSVCYAVSCYNQHPKGTKESIKSAVAASGSGVVPFETMYKYTLNHGVLGKYPALRKKEYNSIKSTKAVGFDKVTLNVDYNTLMSFIGLDGSAGGTGGTVTSVAGDGTDSASNTLFGQITQLGRSILNSAYGTNAVNFVLGTGSSAISSSGTSTGGTYSGTSDPNSNWTWPIHGSINSYITSGFGPRNVGTNPHRGMDIGGAAGQEILAVAPGEVVDVRNTSQDARGKLVQIKHKTSTGQDMYAIYQHNASNLVSTGQTVKQGQAIGIVGNTGSGTGPHLHFEVNPNKTYSISGGPNGIGTQVNPAGYISTSRKYTGSGRSRSNELLNSTNSMQPIKINRKVLDSSKINNINLEKMIKPNETYIGSDGNLYGAPIPGAQGRSGRGYNNYEQMLMAIVNILITVANNTAVLNQILSILASTGVKVDPSAIQKAAGSTRDAKAQIRNIVESANSKRKNNSYAGNFTDLFDGESTAFIVQTMEAIATQ